MNKYFIFLLIIIAAACNTSTTDIPEQEKQLRAAIAEHPDSLLLLENLVQYFRDNGNYSQAVAETDKAIIKDSLSERLLYMKATLLSENDDTTQAINAWEKLIKVKSRPEYLMSLGTLYALKKDPMALAIGELLLSPVGKTQYQGCFIKGLYFNSTGDKKNAIAFFDECMKIDYTNVLAYREKAIAEYDSGTYIESIKTLELSLAINKTYDEAYYWMGRSYEKLGKKDIAINNYKMALEITPDYIEAKDALGKLGVVQ